MASNIESLVNQALVDIGYQGPRVTDIREGSEAANAALEVYSQTRDELLDADDWPFSRRGNVPLTLLKGPPPGGGYNPNSPWSPRYPAPGWLYEYLYPDDCIELKAILRPPQAMFDLNPQPATWRIDNDNSLVDRDGNPTTQKKVILTNMKSALAVYIGEVNDPGLWEPGFTLVVVQRLGEKLSRRLRLGEMVRKDEAAEAGASFSNADLSRG